MELECPTCQKTLRVSDDSVGQRLNADGGLRNKSAEVSRALVSQSENDYFDRLCLAYRSGMLPVRLAITNWQLVLRRRGFGDNSGGLANLLCSSDNVTVRPGCKC